MTHGLNSNMVHRWLRVIRQAQGFMAQLSADIPATLIALLVPENMPGAMPSWASDVDIFSGAFAA